MTLAMLQVCLAPDPDRFCVWRTMRLPLSPSLQLWISIIWDVVICFVGAGGFGLPEATSHCAIHMKEVYALKKVKLPSLSDKEMGTSRLASSRCLKGD